MKKNTLLLFFALLLAVRCFAQPYFFNYSHQLFDPPTTLFVQVQSVDPLTGVVVINGVETQPIIGPFTWIWGDNSVTTGYFPQSHTYSDLSQNYILKVISTYSPTDKDTAEAIIWFTSPQITPVPSDTSLMVYIPDHTMTFGTRLYPLTPDMDYFDDSFFPIVPRSTIEYILSVSAGIQDDFVNQDVYRFNGKFEQYLMRDSAMFGAYSLWFSDPVAFCSGDVFFTGTIGYSSLFHEMGHNVTLNSPASYYYGGKIDGCANAIFSESMAQIFQHATGYELVNNYQTYGFGLDLMTEIRLGVTSSISVVRNSYDTYVSSGKNFQSWNSPGSTNDETYLTFMTIAYKFCEKAETTGLGYKEPLKRMMAVLQKFNPGWQQMYDPLNNSSSGATFRSTLMVSSMSYAFEEDLRNEFRELNFPINDSLYTAIYSAISDIRSAAPKNQLILFPNPARDVITVSFKNATVKIIRLEFYDTYGRLLATKMVENGGSVRLDEINQRSGLLFVKALTDGECIVRELIME